MPPAPTRVSADPRGLDIGAFDHRLDDQRPVGGQHVGQYRRAMDFFVGRFRPHPRNIGFDRAKKQLRRLRQVSDDLTKLVRLKGSQVHEIEPDRARRRKQKLQQHRATRGLAGAGIAGHRAGFAGAEAEGEGV